MSDAIHLVTGGTGLLGSHLVERLIARGLRVRCLVRPASDTRHLRSLGVELVEGDVADADSVRRATAGVSVVFHAAARVSDWGPWSLFQASIVDTTRNVLAASKAEGVGRIVHVSSISVYGRPRVRPGELVSEDAPLGQRLMLWDHYARAKLLAEELARSHGSMVVVVRPSWCYGERDRVTIPRVVAALRAGRAMLIGSGNNLLNIIHASDVAEGITRAGLTPGVGGETFNLSSSGEVTQRQLLDTLCDLLGLPRVKRHVPFWLALRSAFLLELWGKATCQSQPPTITRRAVYLIGRPPQFSTVKARRLLGWQPEVAIADGIQRTLRWFASA
jgi:nucleoside-diphosphate-sugar epimerase